MSDGSAHQGHSNQVVMLRCLHSSRVGVLHFLCSILDKVVAERFLHFEGVAEDSWSREAVGHDYKAEDLAVNS